MLWAEISVEGAWGALSTVASAVLAFILWKAKSDARAEIGREKAVAREIAELRAREQEALNRWITEVRDSQKIMREETEKREEAYIRICIELKDAKSELQEVNDENTMLKKRLAKLEATEKEGNNRAS